MVVSLNEIILLLGHAVKFKSDNPFNLAKFFSYKGRFDKEIPSFKVFKMYMNISYKTENYS